MREKPHVRICAGGARQLASLPLRRREFMMKVGSLAAFPSAARAQSSNPKRRLGVLLFSDQDRVTIRPFLQGLEALGYVDGRTIAIEYRDAQANYDRLPTLAGELVRLNPEVIFSFGGEQASIVKNATATIPIVVVVSNDPVESGLVASLGRPGGNITGLTYVHEMLAGKSLELLKDMAPSVSRVGILWDPRHTDPEFRETQRAAQAIGTNLRSLEVRQDSDFDLAYEAAVREKVEALIVIGSRLVARHRQAIGEFVARQRLILVGVPKWLLEVGALLTYGPNPVELNRRAAAYVDKILRGAKPSDLPMQQPTTFELAINLTAAKALGLAIAPTLLARADEIIE